MRLAVCNDWYDKKSAVFWNKDGFLKMLDVLRKRDGWEVKFFKMHDRTFEWEHDYVDLHFSPNVKQAVLDYKPDAILFFSDFSRPLLKEMEDCGIPIACCYTGGRFTDFEKIPDIVFVESKTYVDWMKARGINVVQAFGTNTELFKPYPQPKFFEAFFPATMAAWKRHELFAEAFGPKGLTCGWWQPHEPQVIENLFAKGVGVLHHQLPESIVQLYNMSDTVVITSHDTGGSQRAVLEALACNIPTIVMNDSTMTSEYIRECGEGGIVEPQADAIRQEVANWKGKTTNTRDWVLANYSEFIYADKIKAGIESICPASVFLPQP